jgi:hypothetical protein
MNVTIYLPGEALALIEEKFMNKFGRVMSRTQLVEFLKSDVVQVYLNELDNSAAGLNDALDMFIAD